VKRIRSKISWFLLLAGIGILIVTTNFVGPLFFINRTESMRRGIYIKRWDNLIGNGDVVVFKSKQLRINLLKFVVAKYPSEFCVTDGGALFVDGLVVAEQNIEKHPIPESPSSRCQRLIGDELLVLGEHPNSYDSRYFGPIKLDDVIALVELLWDFN